MPWKAGRDAVVGSIERERLFLAGVRGVGESDGAAFEAKDPDEVNRDLNHPRIIILLFTG